MKLKILVHKTLKKCLGVNQIETFQCSNTADFYLFIPGFLRNCGTKNKLSQNYVFIELYFSQTKYISSRSFVSIKVGIQMKKEMQH